MTRYWSRTKLGKERVYWYATRGMPWVYDYEVLGEGIAPTFEEAEQDAIAVAGPDLEPLQTYFADRRYREKVKEQRSTKRAKRQEVSAREYVYRFGWSDYDGSKYVLAHLILKKTRKKVYVTDQRIPIEDIGTDREVWSNPYHDPDIALDHAVLEREGDVWSRRNRDYFYTRPDAHAWSDSGRGGRSFPLLGLTAPFSRDDVKSAYRRRVKEVHPDCGGTEEQFIQVEREYREATIWAQPA